MATSKTLDTNATPAVKKVRKTVTLVDRTKQQLSTAALKAKITVDELTVLEGHITKLKALLS